MFLNKKNIDLFLKPLKIFWSATNCIPCHTMSNDQMGFQRTKDDDCG